MAFDIKESFEVQAPIEEVWAFLIDPRRVVVCLPGAEVTDVIDDRSYKGRVKVKVGPVTARYVGTVRLEEANEAQHVVRLKGEGKESGGSGSARMSMTGRLSSVASAQTQVDVDAEIDIAGKMARFGRGVMEDVSRHLFREFAKNTQERLAEPVNESSSQQTARTASSDNIGLSAGGRDVEANASEPSSTVSAQTAQESTRPVGILSVVFRATWSRLKRLVGG